MADEVIARALALLSRLGTKVDYGNNIATHTHMDLEGLYIEDNVRCVEVLWKHVPVTRHVKGKVVVIDPMVRKTVIRRSKSKDIQDFSSNLKLMRETLEIFRRHMVLDDIAGV